MSPAERSLAGFIAFQFPMVPVVAVRRCRFSSGLSSPGIRSLRNARCATRFVADPGARWRVLSLCIARGGDLCECSYSDHACKTGDHTELAELIHLVLSFRSAGFPQLSA